MTEAELALIQEDIFCKTDIPAVFVPENPQEFRKTFFSVVNSCISDSSSLLTVKSEMLLLIGQILRQFSEGKNLYRGDSARRLQAIREYIDTNYMSALSLVSIAALFSCNKYTLIRQFKEHFGETVIQYYNRKRFECAENLLKSTVLTVREIGEILNFSDEYTFSRFFKKHSGAAPSVYRRLLQ